MMAISFSKAIVVIDSGLDSLSGRLVEALQGYRPADFVEIALIEPHSTWQGLRRFAGFTLPNKSAGGLSRHHTSFLLDPAPPHRVRSGARRPAA